jgi:hypothetical protein
LFGPTVSKQQEVDMKASWRVWVVVGVATSTGCIRAGDVDQVVPVAGLTRAVVQISKGDVDVVGAGAASEAVVEASWGGLGGGPLGVWATGDTLHVDARCSGGLCGGDVRIALPDHLALEVVADSGDVRVAGLAAPVVVSLGAGDLDVSGFGAVDLVAGAGDVRVDLWDRADVAVDLGAGDLDLDVPAGAWAVDIDARGDLDVSGIQDDPSAPYSLTVRVGAGDTRVAGS